MKSLTYYELWICYSHNKWHDLKRSTETEHRARHIAEEIVKEHTKTTKIALVRVTVTRETDVVYIGKNTILKPRMYAKCKECGKKKAKKNLTAGVCSDCMTSDSQADLDLADSERNCIQQP
jgi:hypothetical protein